MLYDINWQWLINFWHCVDVGIISQGNFLIFDNLTKFWNDIDDQNFLLATVHTKLFIVEFAQKCNVMQHNIQIKTAPRFDGIIVWHNKNIHIHLCQFLRDFIMYSNDEKTDMILLFDECCKNAVQAANVYS
jgi:hypothetical protein